MAEIVGYYDWKIEQRPEWSIVEFAQFPTIEDYIEALSSNIGTTNADELYLRKSILWGFNDRVRNGMELFINDGEEVKWSANIERLVDMQDINEVNDKILKAELYRYQGQFDKCMTFMRSLPTPDFEWLVKVFDEQCQANNRMVFRLN
jgi:hypothetical protein